MKHLLFISILFSFLNTTAQESGSCVLGSCEASLDTTDVKRIHRFYNSLDFVNIGNIGLSGYHLIYNAERQSNFEWSNMIGSKDYKITTYDVKTPYTKILYVLGAQEEQYLSLIHTQNISRRANFSVGFDKVNSDGMYLNQATDNNHFYSNIWLKSKKENYKFLLNFDHERIFNELNGGIVYDSVFELDESLNRNRQLSEVYLDEASSNIKRSKLDLLQLIRLHSTLDSMGVGSEQKLFVQTEGSINSRNYKDTLLNLDYYTTINLDSTVTKDEQRYESVKGALGYRWDKKGVTDAYVQLKGFVELLTYETLITDTNYQDIGVEALLGWNNDKLFVDGRIENHFHGARQGDALVKGSARYEFSSNWEVNAGALWSKVSPSLDQLSYYGNHTSWNNSFTPTDHLNISGAIRNKKEQLQLKFGYTDIKSPIIYNYLAEPQQLDGVAQIIQTQLSKRFEMGKWEFTPNAVYQYSGGFDIYQLPEVYGELRIGYHVKAFKNKMKLYLGADVWYASKYNALAYNPIIGQYTINTSKTIGNYPMVDVFMNGKIKTVRFFFKMNHINAGIPGYTYYGALNHPLRDRAFQIGVNWEFYD